MDDATNVIELLTALVGLAAAVVALIPDVRGLFRKKQKDRKR